MVFGSDWQFMRNQDAIRGWKLVVFVIGGLAALACLILSIILESR